VRTDGVDARGDRRLEAGNGDKKRTDRVMRSRRIYTVCALAGRIAGIVAPRWGSGLRSRFPRPYGLGQTNRAAARLRSAGLETCITIGGPEDRPDAGKMPAPQRRAQGQARCRQDACTTMRGRGRPGASLETCIIIGGPEDRPDAGKMPAPQV
jgi:hypothetical protein